jgi:hypothetical protein
MTGVAETSLEPRKEWVKPELKKIDIEQITAHNVGSGNDHRAISPNKS